LPAARRRQPHGALHQEGGDAPLLLDALHDPRAQHLEQARDHHHDRGAHLLDVGGQLVETLGIVDLATHADGQELAAGMLIGVGEGEEGEERLVAPFEILGQNARGARDIVQDGAMVLLHPRGAPPVPLV
jgi:hypothetical protein